MRSGNYVRPAKVKLGQWCNWRPGTDVSGNSPSRVLRSLSSKSLMHCGALVFMSQLSQLICLMHYPGHESCLPLDYTAKE